MKKPKKKKRYWVNVYKYRREMPEMGSVHSTKKNAIEVGPNRIKTISFTL